ncbi:alpha/beta fold hydrolase [Nocardia sp. NPDC049149]|uniref:alpha/beta fold hydrolase n=1 Tax=Nocardia sp. NPDC049149 TaxID=3364315 RepID=UPI0037241262
MVGCSGPPVLLLHGHPRTSATWHRVAPTLAQRGFTVLCGDLRSCRRSAGPEPAVPQRSPPRCCGDLSFGEMIEATACRSKVGPCGTTARRQYGALRSSR